MSVYCYCYNKRERGEDRKEGRKEGRDGGKKARREREKKNKDCLPHVNFPTFQAGQRAVCSHSDLHRPLGVCHIESVMI